MKKGKSKIKYGVMTLVICLMFSITKIKLVFADEGEFIEVNFNKNNTESAYSVMGRGGVNLENRLIYYLNKANRTIDVAVYDLNLPRITDKLIDKAGEGVRVRVIVDAKSSNDSRYKLMKIQLERLLRGKDGIIGTVDDCTIFSDSPIFACVDQELRQKNNLKSFDGLLDSTIKISNNYVTGKILCLGEKRDSNRYYAAYKDMHHKFVIIDKKIVWTGSWNMTITGLYGNEANMNHGKLGGNTQDVIVLGSEKAAEIYTKEFEQMWGSKEKKPNELNSNFNTRKKDNNDEQLSIDGKVVEIYFGKSDNPVDKIVEKIESVNHSIVFNIFAWSDQNLVDAMKEKYENNGEKTGINIKGVFDSSSWNQWWSASKEMNRTGGKSTKNNPYNGWDNKPEIYEDKEDRKLHSKFMVIDGGTNSDPMVITGSCNWSQKGNQENDENTVIIHDEELSKIYMNQFYSTFKRAGGNYEVKPSNTSGLSRDKSVTWKKEGELQIGRSFFDAVIFGDRIYALFGNKWGSYGPYAMGKNSIECFNTLDGSSSIQYIEKAYVSHNIEKIDDNTAIMTNGLEIDLDDLTEEEKNDSQAYEYKRVNEWWGFPDNLYNNGKTIIKPNEEKLGELTLNKIYEKGAYSISRYSVATGVDEKKNIYIVGGGDENTSETSSEKARRLEIYNSNDNIVMEKNRATRTKQFAAGAVLNDKFYVGGGHSDYRGVLSEVDVYDIESNEWSKTDDLNVPRTSLEMVSVNDKLYAIGGLTSISSYNYSGIVEEYDPYVKKWMTLDSLKYPRANFACVVKDSKIYAIGGNDGTNGDDNRNKVIESLDLNKYYKQDENFNYDTAETLVEFKILDFEFKGDEDFLVVEQDGYYRVNIDDGDSNYFYVNYLKEENGEVSEIDYQMLDGEKFYYMNSYNKGNEKNFIRIKSRGVNSIEMEFEKKLQKKMDPNIEYIYDDSHTRLLEVINGEKKIIFNYDGNGNLISKKVKIQK